MSGEAVSDVVVVGAGIVGSRDRAGAGGHTACP